MSAFPDGTQAAEGLVHGNVDDASQAGAQGWIYKAGWDRIRRCRVLAHATYHSASRIQHNIVRDRVTTSWVPQDAKFAERSNICNDALVACCIYDRFHGGNCCAYRPVLDLPPVFSKAHGTTCATERAPVASTTPHTHVHRPVAIYLAAGRCMHAAVQQQLGGVAQPWGQAHGWILQQQGRSSSCCRKPGSVVWIAERGFQPDTRSPRHLLKQQRQQEPPRQQPWSK